MRSLWNQRITFAHTTSTNCLVFFLFGSNDRSAYAHMTPDGGRGRLLTHVHRASACTLIGALFSLEYDGYTYFFAMTVTFKLYDG